MPAFRIQSKSCSLPILLKDSLNLANVFQKVQLRFWDGSVREKRGRKKAVGETGEIRQVSPPGLEIPDREEKERGRDMGVGVDFPLPF